MTTPIRFQNAKVSKAAKFMGESIDIKKFSVSQVLKIQELAKVSEQDATGVALLFYVLQEGAPELAAMSEDELKEFPMDELNTLSTEILKYSGLGK